MFENKCFALFSGFSICVLLVTACGGGGGSGDSSPLSIMVVSVNSAGEEGDVDSFNPSVSSDGRYVAFDSAATNLVSDDTNTVPDVFVHDTSIGMTARVSVSSAGTEITNGSTYPSISADGRHVAFYTNSRDLAAEDINNYYDIYSYDRDTGIVSLVSVSSAGLIANQGSFFPYVSSTGRYVAFESRASNLVDADTNGTGFADIFVRDTTSGITERVSVSTAGSQTNMGSYEPVVSADGRYVAFYSDASNLVPDDTNNSSDIFFHDTNTGITSCLSMSPAGTVGDSNSSRPSMSSDGRYVVFDSFASNLVSGDTNDGPDVFIHDTDTGITSLLSVSTAGTQGVNGSWFASISSNGRYVAFRAIANNLVPDDNNGFEDIFVRDIQTGMTSRVSVSATGVEANGYCYNPAISSDGRYVAFESTADNLIDGVTLSGARHIFLAPVP